MWRSMRRPLNIQPWQYLDCLRERDGQLWRKNISPRAIVPVQSVTNEIVQNTFHVLDVNKRYHSNSLWRYSGWVGQLSNTTNILICNVRGLNKGPKQREVRNLLAQNKTRLVGLVETKVKIAHENRMLNRIAPHWVLISKGTVGNRSRILMMWDQNPYPHRWFLPTWVIQRPHVTALALNLIVAACVEP